MAEKIRLQAQDQTAATQKKLNEFNLACYGKIKEIEELMAKAQRHYEGSVQQVVKKIQTMEATQGAAGPDRVDRHKMYSAILPSSLFPAPRRSLFPEGSADATRGVVHTLCNKKDYEIAKLPKELTRDEVIL